jgi:hypothetical protein
MGETVRVLVAQRRGSEFPGFWAEFEGEKVSSYEEPGSGKDIVYTLYRCTAYNFDAYRVHIADESNPDAPVYELHPFVGDSRPGRGQLHYTEVWELENIAEHYPLFLKDVDYFETRHVDPEPSSWNR